MEVCFKDGGKVTIKDMSMVLFDTIQELLWKAQDCEWKEVDGKYINEVGISCRLEKEMIEAVKEINWTL